MSAEHTAALSAHDSHVLEALFDPELSLSAKGPQIDTSIQTLPHVTESTLQHLRIAEADILRPLNADDPSTEAIRGALHSIDKLVDENPSYASAYVNRAQTNRLLLDRGEAGNVSTLTNSVLSDLSKAIKLATPTSPTAPVSGAQAKLLSTAHTHRAYLLHKLAQAEPQGPQDLETKEQLEDMASQDFFLGGRYGDKVAQQMSVFTNPYAKMCGAIVKEALREEMKGVSPLN